MRRVYLPVLLFLSALARADDAEVVYYDIVGSTDRALNQQMHEKGPIGTEGKRVDGHTHWHVQWYFHYQPANEGCRFTDLDVTVTGTITLPRWAGDEGPAALRKKWRRFVDALRIHEDGHYAHGLSAAREIEALGRTFRIAEGCAAISKRFNTEAQAILTKYQKADVDYDADTRHGRSQGAVFP
jgi:predicted secreted Zn-dependent protease